MASRLRCRGRAAGRCVEQDARAHGACLAVAAVAGQGFEAGHAHRHAHLDLLADDAAVDVVGHVGVDLDAAVHRPGMHDERVGLGGRQLVVVEAEEVEIFAHRGHEAAVHAFGLEPQHHDDVDVVEARAPCRDRPRRRAARSRPAARCAAPRRGHGRPWCSAARCWSARRGCAGCRRRWRRSGPASRPLRRRMVSASSSAWVGCSWLPSPALMTAQLTFSDSSCTAPDSGWRTTSTSGCMALSVIAVSISVSPFLIELAWTDMLMTSPPRRLPASSKEVRVRVEFSKNRLMMVRPRSSDCFLSRLAVLLDVELGTVEQIGDLVGGKPFDPQEMPVGKRVVRRANGH